jgi:hypothetical protein
MRSSIFVVSGSAGQYAKGRNKAIIATYHRISLSSPSNPLLFNEREIELIWRQACYRYREKTVIKGGMMLVYQ